MNVFLHGVNTVSCLLDIMITARPIRVHHFYLAIIFGLYYTFFSLIYWAAGGHGLCRPLQSEQCEYDPYIYPILDWDGKPGLAVGMILGSCVLMPLLQAGWWGLSCARSKIRQSIMS